MGQKELGAKLMLDFKDPIHFIQFSVKNSVGKFASVNLLIHVSKTNSRKSCATYNTYIIDTTTSLIMAIGQSNSYYIYGNLRQQLYVLCFRHLKRLIKLVLSYNLEQWFTFATLLLTSP